MKKMKKERRKIRNLRVKRTEKARTFFFFFFVLPFNFQETTETFKGSIKMEISTGKNLKSCQESDFAPPENFSCYASDRDGLHLVIDSKNFPVTLLTEMDYIWS